MTCDEGKPYSSTDRRSLAPEGSAVSRRMLCCGNAVVRLPSCDGRRRRGVDPLPSPLPALTLVAPSSSSSLIIASGRGAQTRSLRASPT